MAKRKKSRLMRLLEKTEHRDDATRTTLEIEGEAFPFCITLGGLSHAAKAGYNPAAALQRLVSRQGRLLRAFYKNFDEETLTAIFQALREQENKDRSAGEVIQELLVERAGLDTGDDAVEAILVQAEALEPVMNAMADSRSVREMEDRQALLMSGLYDTAPDITRAMVEKHFGTWGALEAAWSQVQEAILAFTTVAETGENGQADPEEVAAALLLEEGSDNTANPT